MLCNGMQWNYLPLSVRNVAYVQIGALQTEACVDGLVIDFGVVHIQNRIPSTLPFIYCDVQGQLMIECQPTSCGHLPCLRHAVPT